MWPELLDMTREESKRILRRVELEAYSSVISAFRAQGDLNKEKKKILHDLQQILSISTERHRAEVRRAVNDEKLATIADNMSPSNGSQEWLTEGRRLVPLLPRLVPQTAFTVTANQVANMQAEKNASLPSPSQTGLLEHVAVSSAVSSPPSTPWTSRPSSPTSNVVVLPSGMSIHIKGGLDTGEEDDGQVRKRRRTTSSESLFSPPGPPVPQVTYTTTIANTSAMSPKKITISKSPQAQPRIVASGSQTQPRVVASGSQTQKVILVSSQGHSPQVSMTTKSVTMPLMRSMVSTGTSTTNTTKSVVLPVPSSVTTSTNVANIVTMTTPSYLTSTTSAVLSPVAATTIGTSTTAFLTPTISVTKPRFKTVPRQKILQVPAPRPGVVIPMSTQPVQPSPQTIQAMKFGPKPTIQIRQEGSMKIITQNMTGGTSKILPKPSQISTQAGTPLVVVSATSTAQTSTVSMVTRTATSIAGAAAGTKVLNIQTQGGKIIAAPRGSSVVTVNPKTLHLTAVKNASGLTGGKPNVIVVQKTQPRRTTVPLPHGLCVHGKSTSAIISSPFEKELVSFLQKQDPTKQYVVTTTTASLAPGTNTQRKVIVTTSGHADLAKQLQLTQTLQRAQSETSQPSSNILQDLIQAVGIVPDSNHDNHLGEVTLNLDESQLTALTSASQESSQSKVSTAMPSNEWFEYDVTDEQGNTYTHTAESADTAAAIQSLLDMQANSSGQKPKVMVQRSSSVDISQLSDHLNQQQFYTLEQAMTLLNQTEREQDTQYMTAESQELSTEQDAEDNIEDEILTAVPLNVSISQEVQSGMTTVHSRPVTTDSGDLDPQTGMFYVEKGQIIGGGLRISTSGGPLGSSNDDNTARKYDLLSSSLAHAQIDLDPFRFIDDSGHGNSLGSVSSNQTANQKVENTNTVESLDNVGSVGTMETVVIQKAVSTPITITTTPSIRIQPQSTFIPIQEALKSSVTPSTISFTKQISNNLAPTSAPSIHVTVEPSGMDTSFMKIEDFTSQQMSDKGDFVTDFTNPQMTDKGNFVTDFTSPQISDKGDFVTDFTSPQLTDKGNFVSDFTSQPLSDKADFVTDVGIDHMEEISTDDSIQLAGSSSLSEHIEGFQSLESHIQAECRKRKLMSGEDQGSSIAAPGGWVRAALGVLNKVSKYRGVNRDKNDLNAATWFIQPVDPSDAPDYYTIVEHPMDFGTIKKKLECGKYLDFEDFHADMILVKDNCYLYNPEQSAVRRDCDDVFQFYLQEYEKLMDKWQKSHIGSPISKKPKPDLSKSPIRP